MPTDAQVEAAAYALVPFSFGAFEWQTHPDGSRVQPPKQPNDHARKAARAALQAATPTMVQVMMTPDNNCTLDDVLVGRLGGIVRSEY